jgi:ABC-type dipeptide/oligopeptide/nickel transport system ATPase subunit
MLEARKLAYRYRQEKKWLFKEFDIHIAQGEIVGISGPSGRGKSTLAKILSGYLSPLEGSVWINGHPLPASGHNPVQLLFQHPELAVNPRWKTGAILRESEDPTTELLQELAIDSSWLNRYPHELSGGELQRICLARALGAHTRYLLCDEMTSMLDTLTQASIWHSILSITRHRELGLLVISHDYELLKKLCTRIITF